MQDDHDPPRDHHYYEVARFNDDRAHDDGAVNVTAHEHAQLVYPSTIVPAVPDQHVINDREYQHLIDCRDRYGDLHRACLELVVAFDGWDPAHAAAFADERRSAFEHVRRLTGHG